MRRRPVLMLAAALVMALSGCVGLPDSGEVTVGQVDQGEAGDGGLEYIAERPAPGASQEEVVLGFLQAAISPPDDFDIAREYLTEDFASQWDPMASVIVRSGQPVVSEIGDATLEVAVDAAGMLDDHGTYTRLGAEPSSLTFELVAEDGEWRIDAGPQGIVLTPYYFERLFEAESLSWFTPDRAWAVPDVRWQPISDETPIERIVDAVLAGPVDWLAPAVWTGGVEEARRMGAVDVDGSTATVTVSDEQAAGDDAAAQTVLLAQQLQLALDAAGHPIDEVVVESEGLVVTSTDAPPLATPDLDDLPVGLIDDELVALGSTAASALSAGPALAEAGASDAIAFDDGSITSALAGDEVVRIGPDAEPLVLAEDIEVPPSLDRAGWTWWVDAAGTIWVSNGDRARALGTVGDAAVLAIEVSRDGARIAIVTSGTTVAHVQVAGIVRDGEGAPMSLTTGVIMADVAGVGQDVTWTDQQSIAVLSETDEGSSIVHAEVGGASLQLPSPPQDVTQLVGGDDGAATLRARGQDGTVLAIRGGAWQAGSDPARVELILTRI